MSEQIEYFFAELDSNLMHYESAEEALAHTVRVYREVWELKPIKKEALMKKTSKDQREVTNNQEESGLILPLLENIENILMVESSGIAQKFIPRDKWVKGVMKRIEKEVLHFTISNLPLLEENVGESVASDKPELSASEFLENVLNGEWSNSCKVDILAALGVMQSLLMRFSAEEMMKAVKDGD